MIYSNDNPGQGSRGGQEPGEDNLHKSQRSQDNQKNSETPDYKESGRDDKFSPGEPDDYNAEEFSTD